MNLTLEIPDDLAKRLEDAAATRHISLEQFAVNRLNDIPELETDPPRGSKAAILKMLRESPPLAPDIAAEFQASLLEAKNARRPRL